jgi:hypothetical protein
MAAAKYDFSIEQGSSFTLTVVYKDADENIVDLTNWCARLIFRANDGTVYDYPSVGADTSIYSFDIDGPNGKLTFLLSALATNGYSFTTAKYDLELTSPNDFYSGGGKLTTKILYGNITIIKRYSQTTDNLAC